MVPRRLKVVTALEGDGACAGDSSGREAEEEEIIEEEEEEEQKRLEQIESGTFPRTSRRSKSYGNETEVFASPFKTTISDNYDDEKVKNMTKMNTMRNLMDGYFDDDDDDDSNIVKQQEITRSKHRKDKKHKRAKSFGFYGDGHENSMRTVNNASTARDRDRRNRLKRVLEPINDALTRVDTARRAALRFAASISEGIGKFAVSKRIPVLIFSFILAAYEAYVASTLKPARWLIALDLARVLQPERLCATKP